MHVFMQMKHTARPYEILPRTAHYSDMSRDGSLTIMEIPGQHKQWPVMVSNQLI